MTLAAYSTLANLHASLDAYLASTLADTEGLALVRHGVARFIPPSAAAWVAVRFDELAGERRFYRQVTSSQVGTEVQGVLRLCVLQQTRLWDTRYTLTSARDAVVKHFPESGLIPLKDYSERGAEAASQVGVLLLDGLEETLVDDGRQSGLIQHEIRVRCRYLDVVSAPA